MLVIKENQKRRANSYTTTRFNQHQSAICAPLYKTRWFKHRLFDQPFEIKAESTRVKTTNALRHRKRSDHKLW